MFRKKQLPNGPQQSLPGRTHLRRSLIHIGTRPSRDGNLSEVYCLSYRIPCDAACPTYIDFLTGHYLVRSKIISRSAGDKRLPSRFVRMYPDVDHIVMIARHKCRIMMPGQQLRNARARGDNHKRLNGLRPHMKRHVKSCSSCAVDSLMLSWSGVMCPGLVCGWWGVLVRPMP